MADVFNRAQRSRVMAAVRSRGNRATELRLASLLRRHGLSGWRRHPALPGRPDFIWPKLKLAVFVDGCFWHGCPRHGTMPATRRAFWEAKIGRNRTRDRAVTRELRAKGWRVLRIWEHALKVSGESALLRRLRAALETKKTPETKVDQPPQPKHYPGFGRRVRLSARTRPSQG